jgi:hypothetical protein
MSADAVINVSGSARETAEEPLQRREVSGSAFDADAAAGEVQRAAETASDREIRASVLERIPDSGTTLSALADGFPQDRSRIAEAVTRLAELGLIETDGHLVRTTAFTQKAKRIFQFR